MISKARLQEDIDALDEDQLDVLDRVLTVLKAVPPDRARSAGHGGESPALPRLVPSLQRGNAALDAPASRDPMPRWNVATCSHVGAWES